MNTLRYVVKSCFQNEYEPLTFYSGILTVKSIIGVMRMVMKLKDISERFTYR